MRASVRAILDKLDAVETEMKAIGYWDEDPGPPPDNPLAPPSFAAWVQLTFLPSARERARDDDLPEKSDVGVLALRQYDYHSHVPEAQKLMKLLFEFDRLVVDAAREAEKLKKEARAKKRASRNRA